MSKDIYKVGMIIYYPFKEDEYGAGEVLSVTATTVDIFFHDDPKQTVLRFSRFNHSGEINWNSSRELSEEVVSNELEERPIFYDSDSEIAHLLNPGVSYFSNPYKIYSLNDLEKSPPPRCSGIYGWYFDEPPPYVLKNGCTLVKTGWWPFRTKWWLLYIGKSKNLNDRIMTRHIKGRLYPEGTMSSFRLSLGCLLSDKLGLELYYPRESFGQKEEKLQNWLNQHTRVTWIDINNLDAVELAAIERYILPLNYEHNQHPLKIPLSNLRADFKKIAQSQNPEKKYFKKAYKTFVNECRSLEIKK